MWQRLSVMVSDVSTEEQTEPALARDLGFAAIGNPRIGTVVLLCLNIVALLGAGR